MLFDKIEIKSIRKIAGEWHVVVTIPNNCGCQLNRRVIRISGDKEPTKEEICKLL